MASAFEHYLYVLECGDGSLYTGYATDVAARLEAHRSGRGARYTRSHAPLRLVAQARFYGKARAMRAEALFKRLPRSRKDALLAKAEGEPFEVVLARELPGFGGEDAREFACRSLASQVDPEYGAFMARLIPTLPRNRVAGVRTPALRALAKELAGRDDAELFMRALPHALFEENQLHAFLLGFERDYGRALARYERFLPYVDNWATCDQMPMGVLGERPRETLGHVERWLASGSCYVVRFGIGVLMRLYLDERFDQRHLALVAAARLPGAPDRPRRESEAYYVDMMRAWYFAEALVRQREAALPYMERRDSDALLDEWTRRRAIQKALESRRVGAEMKEYLRSCR